jgi:hypothetical protein
MGLVPGAPDIQPHELLSRLLQATEQDEPGTIDPARLLEFLHLSFLPVDFETALGDVLPTGAGKARALLSFPDRLVAVDAKLDPRRVRFSALHEVAHYVLPEHRHALYLCDDHGMGLNAQLNFEIEANQFAADLLFKGPHFVMEANGEPISAATVKTLALRYGSSFEAAARRLVEKHHRPVMFVVCERKVDQSVIDTSLPAVWRVKYCRSSASFRAGWFPQLDGEMPDDLTAALTAGGRDVADSIVGDVPIGASASGGFRAEWFYNRYNIMGLLTPNRS